MSLELIIGRSNSGKSKLLYTHIKELENKGSKAIVFVPDFARIVAEQEYFKYTENLGMINTKITTMKRFAEQNIDKKELLGNKEYLPELAKMFLIKKCISDNTDLFNVFRKVQNTQGFVDKLYKLMSVFESQGINDEVVSKLQDKNNFLSIKFQEIYNIYKKVQEKTEERFITGFEQFEFFINKLEQEGIEKMPQHVFFDSFNNFNLNEYKFIQTLLNRGINVTITLDLDYALAQENLTDIFLISYETYRKLKNLAKEVGVEYNEVILAENEKTDNMLKVLQQNIFSLGVNKTSIVDETVKLRLLKNPYDEIEYISQDITNKIRSGKYRFQDFKIYYNNEVLYDLNIQRLFQSYNIPVYINGSHQVKSNMLTVYITNLFELAINKFSTTNIETIINILKTGLFKFSEEDISIFENYLLEFGIKPYHFNKEFEKNNSKDSMEYVYNLEEINAIRICLLDLVTDLNDKLQNITATKEITSVVYNLLRDNGILEKYNEQLNNIKVYDIDEYNRKKQVVEYIYSVMDNICLAFEALNIEEYFELLKYGIESIEVSGIPPYIDQVEVCNIDRTRSMPRKVVYVIGAFENGLPVLSNSEGMFSDKELALLEEYGIDLAKTSDARNNMALFNVYKAINSCTEELIFTVPSTKLTGESLRLSPLISKIKDIINVELIGNVTDEAEKEKFILKNEYEEFVSKLEKIDDIQDKELLRELYNKYALLEESDTFGEVLRYKRRHDKLDSSTINMLYNKDIKSSVSRLERFKACPFNYYATYVLKLKEKKEYKLSKLDLGSIMHSVIEAYSKFLFANSIGFQDILDNEKLLKKTKEEIDKTIDDIFAKLYTKYMSSSKYAYLKTRLKKGMFNIIIGVAKSFCQSEFRPLGFEIEFDDGKLFAPIEVELSNGSKMYLRGKIDRVDYAKVKNSVYIRIVDYKSSSKDLKLSDVKEGISLQLMAYMSAILENKEKIDKENNVLPVALSYFTLNTQTLNLTECIDNDKIEEKLIDALKMKGIYLNDVEILKKLDNNFADTKKSYIDMTTRKLNNPEKSLQEAVFIEECKNIQETLKKLGDEMTSGVVKRCDGMNSGKACEYCNYSAMCRKTMKG